MDLSSPAVLALTGSPAKAGVVGFAKTLPIAVLALPAGALVDRVNRKHLMVACDGIRALALATIPIALAAGHLPYALIVAVAFIDGAGFVFSYIAERGALRQLVLREQLGEAVARHARQSWLSAISGRTRRCSPFAFAITYKWAYLRLPLAIQLMSLRVVVRELGSIPRP